MKNTQKEIFPFNYTWRIERASILKNLLVNVYMIYNFQTDSILGSYSIPGINFPPLNMSIKILPLETFLLDVSVTSHFHWLLVVYIYAK
jgi:hypothetical protein